MNVSLNSRLESNQEKKKIPGTNPARSRPRPGTKRVRFSQVSAEGASWGYPVLVLEARFLIFGAILREIVVKN